MAANLRNMGRSLRYCWKQFSFMFFIMHNLWYLSEIYERKCLIIIWQYNILPKINWENFYRDSLKTQYRDIKIYIVYKDEVNGFIFSIGLYEIKDNSRIITQEEVFYIKKNAIKIKPIKIRNNRKRIEGPIYIPTRPLCQVIHDMYINFCLQKFTNWQTMAI